MVSPARVGTSRRLPEMAGVANREVRPTEVDDVEWPVLGTSACRCRLGVERPHPAAADHGEPVMTDDARQSLTILPFGPRWIARRPSSQGT